MRDSDTLPGRQGDVEQQLRVRNRLLESMLDLGRAVSSELQLEALCELIVARLAHTFDAEAVTLFFRDETTGELSVKSSFVAQHPLGDDAATKRAAQAALHTEHVVCDDQPGDRDGAPSDRFSTVAVPLKADAPPAPGSDAAATATVPLTAENKVKGVITMSWPAEAARPTEDDLRLLDVVAAQIAPAIDNAWLYGQLESLNVGLEGMVTQRTRALADSNAQLRAALDELTQAQAQLVQSEKMASLGQLTAGVAHEINNPLAFAISNNAIARERLGRMRLLWRLLAAIADAHAAADPEQGQAIARGFIDRLRAEPAYREDVVAFEADLASSPPSERAALCLEFLRYVRAREEQTAGLESLADGIAALLERSREGLSRVKDIVLDLRSFSRLDQAQLADADLDAGIASTLSIVAHLARERGVALRHERGMTASYPCYAAKLNQVVLNLVTNALQATPQGGTVTIRTRDAAEGVSIEVRDTGAGIPAELLPRIFDPFFTSKPVGQGTGLGLSLSYKIVEEHGGTISVQSRPGEGACFTIALPPRCE